MAPHLTDEEHAHEHGALEARIVELERRANVRDALAEASGQHERVALATDKRQLLTNTFTIVALAITIANFVINLWRH